MEKNWKNPPLLAGWLNEEKINEQKQMNLLYDYLFNNLELSKDEIENIKIDSISDEVKYRLTKKRIKQLGIFISASCNLRCKYCYANSGKVVNNELTIKEYFKIIDQVSELGVEVLRIPGHGETMMDSKFFDGKKFPIIDYANEKGIHVIFFTNGTRISERIAKILFKKDVSIITKLNSFNSEIQDNLAGVRGVSKKIYNGLKNLINIGFNESSPSRLGIESIICEQNIDEIETIFFYARERNIIPHIGVLTHSGRAHDFVSELDVTFDQKRSIFNKILKEDRMRFNFDWEPTPPYMSGQQCSGLFYEIFIDSVGNVVPCSGIKFPIGNIRVEAIGDIMNKEDSIKLRHIDRFIGHPCNKCMNKECKYGCLLETYNMQKNLFQGYPSCF